MRVRSDDIFGRGTQGGVLGLCLAVGWVLGLIHPVGPAMGDHIEFRSEDCLSAPYRNAATPAQVEVRDMVGGLRRALPAFPSLLAALDAEGMRICLSDRLITEKAYFDVEAVRIVLSSDMSRHLSRVVLVHELRHVDQVARGICLSQSLAMKEYARGVLALEADANVAAALVAWQQKDNGDSALWQAFENWPMTADIAARFAKVMTESGSVADAASAAFDQWYASDERIERYYVASCSVYLDRQDLTHALPGYLQLADDYLARLCLLPDGQNYDCVNAGD